MSVTEKRCAMRARVGGFALAVAYELNITKFEQGETEAELFIQVLKETDLKAQRNGIHLEVSSQAAVLSITTLIEIVCFVYSKS